MHMQGKAFYIQRDKIEIITRIDVSEFDIHCYCSSLKVIHDIDFFGDVYFHYFVYLHRLLFNIRLYK